MESKKSLYICRVGKGDIRKENVFDNTRGRPYFFQVRSGGLRTRSYKSKQTQEDYACVCCGKEIETI